MKDLNWIQRAIVIIGSAALFMLVCLALAGSVRGAEAHYIEVIVDSNAGDSARFYIVDNTTGDSVTTGTMTEAARLGGTETVWKGNFSTTLYRPITIIGRVYDSVTVMARFSYEVDLSGKVTIDSLNLVIDSLYAALDTLQKFDDSITAILDTLQNYDSWVAQQAEIANLDGWNPITDNDSLIIDQTSLVALKPTVPGRTLNVTATGAAGVNWGNVENQGTTVDLAATTLFAVDIATNIGAISTNGISAASFQTDAISAAALSTAAVDEFWEYDSTNVSTAASLGQTLKRTYSGQKDSTLMAIRDGALGKNAFKATGFSTHTPTDVWAVATRALTDKAGFSLSAAGVDAIYDEDTTGHNTANSFGKLFKDTLAYQLAAVEFWNVAFGTGFTAGSMGDSLTNASFMQGEASGLTAGAVADAVWDETKTGHTVNDSYGEILTDTLDAKVSSAGSVATIGDADMVAIADTIKNRGDTVFNTAFWHTLALHADSGTSASEWSTGDVDSVLNAIRDGSSGKSNFGTTPALIYSYFTSGTNEDPFKATGFSSHSVADIWAYGARTTTSELWTSTTRDSILNAIRDGSLGKNNFKATGFSTHSVADVYNYFISGTNENQFKADISLLSTFNASTDSVAIQDRGQIAAQTADSVGNITASVDTVAISRSVWNELKSAHTTAGTFGYNLDAQISSIAAPNGDGQYTQQFVLIDSSGTDTVITNRTLTVNNQAQTGQALTDGTDENGIAVFNLNAGNYVVLFDAYGYEEIVDSFTVSAAGTDTIYTYNLSQQGTPITLSLRSYSPGQYANAIVQVNLVAVNDSNVFVGDSLISIANNWSAVDTADANGDLTMYLWSNDVMTGDSTYYQIKATNSTGKKSLIQYTNFHVPNSSAVVNFSDLTAWKP